MNYLSINDSNSRQRSPSPRSPNYIINDRFIPNRSEINMDSSFHLLTNKSSCESSNQSSDQHIDNLKQKLFMENYILNGNVQKHIVNVENSHHINQTYTAKLNSIKTTVQFNYTCCKLMDAPNIINDFYLNLIDWSSIDNLAVAIKDNIYIYDHVYKETKQLSLENEENNRDETYSESVNRNDISSVKWMPGSSHLLAIARHDNTVNVWDINKSKILCKIKDHTSRVATIDWKSTDIITSGDKDGRILNHDIRMNSKKISEFECHKGDVCGLKWSKDKRLLASGSEDKKIIIWDITANSHKPLKVFQDNKAAVKALDWCPWNNHVLATGSGKLDGRIRTWSVFEGTELKSIQTDCQISGVSWCENSNILLASCNNDLTAWKYPQLIKAGSLEGHRERILILAKSDSNLFASLGGDETLRIWDCFAKTKDSESYSYNLSPISTRSLSKFCSIR